jgi:hypothetical protein
VYGGRFFLAGNYVAPNLGARMGARALRSTSPSLPIAGSATDIDGGPWMATTRTLSRTWTRTLYHGHGHRLGHGRYQGRRFMFNIGGQCPLLLPVIGGTMPILSPNQIIGGTRPPGIGAYDTDPDIATDTETDPDTVTDIDSLK